MSGCWSGRSRPASILRASAATAADRVDELTDQRADTTVAQAAELRPIERDLHDGAQARLIGLGLSLATAEKLMETDPEQARALLESPVEPAVGVDMPSRHRAH